MKTKLTLPLLCCMMANAAVAQLTSPENKDKPYIPSWDIYEFMKYGAVGASLYTGTVNYSVPIYVYEDEDFSYSVTLDYATNGFRVNHRSGHLGQGWTLNSPGMITREIYGLADESVKTITAKEGTGCQLYGYNRMPVGNLKRSILVNGDQRAFTAMTDNNGSSYDAQPDIYRFNFCGYSGSFRSLPSAGGERQFLFFDCPSGSQALKIKDFSSNDKIVVIDGKGYEYQFSVGEYTKGTYSEAIDPMEEKFNRQWNLQKITAPNGRTIEFKYRHISDYGGLGKAEHSVTYTPSVSYEFSCFVGSNQDAEYGYGSKDVSIYTSDAYSTRLTGIRFADGTNVSFDYKAGATELRYITPNGQLKAASGDSDNISAINVYSSENELSKKATLSYRTVGGGKDKDNILTFLESVDISGQGSFTFDYNPMEAYPPLGSIKSDHWGYYNGETGGFLVNDFFSNISFDDKYNETYNSTFNKRPDFKSALSGTLCRITYPTGGFSVIDYERHDCSQKVIRTDGTNFLPELSTLNGDEEVGGVRLKQVSTFLSDGTPVDTVRYEYKAADRPNLSSGILINTPRYGIKYQAGAKAVERFNLCNSIYDYTKTHIEYSHVREIKSSAGFTDYFYSTYDTCPDEYEFDGYDDKGQWLNLFGYYSDGVKPSVVVFSNPDDYVTNLLTPFASAQTKRGLLTEVRKHDFHGDVIGVTKYTYNFPMVKMDSVLTLIGEMARDVYYPRYNVELVSEEESLAFDKKVVTLKKFSRFNSLGLETEVRRSFPDGRDIIDSYQYVGGNTGTGGIIGEMRLANNVSRPVGHEQSTVVDGKIYSIKKTEYTYYKPNAANKSLFKVASVKTWLPAEGWSLKESYLHDDYGRIKQVTDSSGVNRSYLWGYNERYPLAIARNLTFRQLEQSVASAGLSVKDLTSQSAYDDGAFVKLLAVADQFPESHLEIYKFKPNFGLTEHSLPNSLKTFYNYDGYGRLSSITDSNQRIVQQGEYNLVTVAPLSATLSCPDTYADGAINATVSAAGGSNTYHYVFKIFDKQTGDLVYENADSDGLLSVKPLEIGMANGQYTINCDVTDLISKEKTTLSKDFRVKPVKLLFSDFTDDGSGTITATIFTDTPTDATFGLELASTETCTISIAGVSRTGKREKDTEFLVPLTAGYNRVSIVYPPTTMIFEATLWIKSATNGHEVGEPNFLDITH